MRRDEIRPVYLSPHLDDVALSCGGLIYRQARDGLRPLVITCFAGTPDYGALSEFAAEQHRRWGQPIDPMGQRQCEDVAAMTGLGAEYEHWEYLDCIYRRHAGSGEFLYASEEALFGSVRGRERELGDRLAVKLCAELSADRTLIHAPLAVGHHVDHQLVLQAALQLCSNGFRVRFYEDYPYAEDVQSLNQALELWTSRLVPMVETLNEEDLKAKIAAIRLYRSQIKVLFGDEASVPPRIESFALRLGAGRGYGERYWERAAA